MAKVELPANNTGGSVNAGLTLDPDTNTVYASVQGEVVEVNGSTNTIVRELPLCFGTLAFDPTTHKLWGTQPGHWALVEVDARTGSVVANVSIGFSPYDIAVDPGTGLVYSDGCTGSFVCGSKAAVVNGTSGTLVANVELGSADYPTMAFDPATHVLYVSGGQQLAAINGTTGGVIFSVNPQTCGPFVNMVVDASSNLVLTAPATGYYYLLAYDGATGKLVNMYSFPSTPVPIALNPSNGELYLWTVAGRFLSIRMLSAPGNVNTALIGSGGQCPLP
jgi:DNA-binding beta-propeller fold protein YncE